MISLPPPQKKLINSDVLNIFSYTLFKNGVVLSISCYTPTRTEWCLPLLVSYREIGLTASQRKIHQIGFTLEVSHCGLSPVRGIRRFISGTGRGWICTKNQRLGDPQEHISWGRQYSNCTWEEERKTFPTYRCPLHCLCDIGFRPKIY